MELLDALIYVIGFSVLWLFTVLLAAGLDFALRRAFQIKIFPDNYWGNNDDCR